MISRTNQVLIEHGLTNFIVAQEIFSGDKVKPKELLVVQALKVRWNKFYFYISSDAEFRNLVKEYILREEDRRFTELETRKTDNTNPLKRHERKSLNINRLYTTIRLYSQFDGFFGRKGEKIKLTRSTDISRWK